MSSQSISLYNNLLAKKRFKKIVNFDLKRMRLALKKLGNPERNLKNIINILIIMSGDNLHGKQPIKFYSEKITLTKVELLERQLSLGEKVLDLDKKHKEWSRKLSG